MVRSRLLESMRRNNGNLCGSTEFDSTDVLAHTPLPPRVPGAAVEHPRPTERKLSASCLGLSTSTEEETPNASPTLAAKEATETPPPKRCVKLLSNSYEKPQVSRVEYLYRTECLDPERLVCASLKDSDALGTAQRLTVAQTPFDMGVMGTSAADAACVPSHELDCTDGSLSCAIDRAAQVPSCGVTPVSSNEEETPTCEEETPDAPPMFAAKEVTETPPPKGSCLLFVPSVEVTIDSSAPVMHAAQSPSQTGPKAFEDMPADQLIEEFDMVTAQQAALVAQLRARFLNERSHSIQKYEEILLLKTQLADAQAEAESSRSYAQNLAEEKMALLVKVEQERADAAEYKASCHWAVKYLEGGKNNHFAGLDEFRQRVEGLLEKQEEKLRKLSIEYDEELYPHMLSAIAERRWLISHGLRLAAMSTLESQEVKQSFGDVVKCALARGKAEAVEELHEKRLLTVPAAQVPGYNDKAYEELVAAMEAMKLLELPHIAQLERDQDYPIDVIMAGLTLARHASEGAEGQPDYFLKPDVAQLQVPIFSRPRDILNPFALEREIPLKESLEAHAIRLAKKKGVKGKAILCGVGAAHIPRSDGVPVSVATVLPKDSELLGKLEEAGDAAYQVGRSEQSRCHSI
ncbi:hypothetical protein Tco_0045182 [Tanacetum coccineum]